MEKTKNDNEKRLINLIDIYSLIKRNKKLYLVSLPVTFVLACFFVLSIPRTYTCDVKLVPELQSSPLSNLSSLSSAIGIDFNTKLQGWEDAISPELYPDLIHSSDFLVRLFDIKIQTKDGNVNTNYYTYLTKYQKAAWWDKAKASIMGLFTKKDTTTFDGSGKVNLFRLTKKQKDILYKIDSQIKCNVDKKTNIISLSVVDQDPLVSATIADSIKSLLQNAITEYRTKKAKNDLAYVKKLYIKSKAEYEKARQAYGSYSDTNMDVILMSYKSKVEDLENEMQIKFNQYNSMATNYSLSLAKVQERTPAFTTLQSASVPLKPSGPKRMIIVLASLVLVFLLDTCYLISKSNN